MKTRFLTIGALLASLISLALFSPAAIPVSLAQTQAGVSRTTTRNFAPSAATTATAWAKTFGTSAPDSAYSTAPTSDGGYIVTGATNFKAWVFKLDGAGNLSWQKTLGAGSLFSTAATPDGGAVIAGSFDVGSGQRDAWVVRLDGSGNIIWQRRYGGGNNEDGAFIALTGDGGYIVAGGTRSTDPNGDAWVFKLDAAGNVLWQRRYGGSDTEGANSIAPTSDGGYIVSGSISPAGSTQSYAWVFKIDTVGNIVWQKSIGTASANLAVGSGALTSDGGYVLALHTAQECYFCQTFAYVVKLDGAGNLVWQKQYGSNGELLNSVAATSDGGSIVAGTTRSFGATSSDAWVIRLDAAGNVVWQKRYGGTQYEDDDAFDVAATGDGGYIVVGQTRSFGAGQEDAWVLKLDANGSIGTSCPLGQSTPGAVANSSFPVAASSFASVATAFPFAATTTTATNAAGIVNTQCSGNIGVTTYVSDHFNRSGGYAWGSAPIGGPYTVADDSASNFTVNGDVGIMNAPVPNRFLRAMLMNVSARDVEANFRFKTDKPSVGGGQIAHFVSRRTSDGNDYLARVRMPTDGSVRLQAYRELSNVNYYISREIIVPGLTHTANTFIRVRVQVVGANPTTIRMRAWADGSPEPSTWQLTTTDSTSQLQSAGAVGLRSYLGREATNAPVKFSYDDFVVTSVP